MTGPVWVVCWMSGTYTGGMTLPYAVYTSHQAAADCARALSSEYEDSTVFVDEVLRVDEP